MSDKFYIGAILFLSFVVGVLYWLNNNAAGKIDELTRKIAQKESNNAVMKADLDTCKDRACKCKPKSPKCAKAGRKQNKRAYCN